MADFEITIGVKNITQKLSLYEYMKCDRLGGGSYGELCVEFYLHTESLQWPESSDQHLLVRVGDEWYMVDVHDIVCGVERKGEDEEADFKVTVDVRDVTQVLLVPVRSMCIGDGSGDKPSARVYLHTDSLSYLRTSSHNLVVHVDGRQYMVNIHDIVTAIAEHVAAVSMEA